MIFFRRSVAYQLSRQKTITIWNLTHLYFWNFQHSFFSLSIKFIEFLVVRFNTSFFILIKLIKSFVVRSYALIWTIKSIKYSNVLELKLIKNQIVLDTITFSIFAAILTWCRVVLDNKVIYQKFKTIRDLMLQ